MKIHLYGVNGTAEYFLQDRQIISVQRGHFSLFKLRREPAHCDQGRQCKTQIRIFDPSRIETMPIRLKLTVQPDQLSAGLVMC